MTKAAELAKMGEVLTNSQIGGRRNIAINGAMNVAQRSASVTGIGASSGYFTVDRYKLDCSSTAGRLTMTQTADGPSGFANCLKLDCTTADTSIAAGEILFLTQRFEGQDLQQIKKGTSDAESLTVSFYVKGNAAATYTCEIADGDNTRLIAQEFSVTTDWARVILTFPPDTTGAYDDDNARSMTFGIFLHAGSNFTSGTFASNVVHATDNLRVGDNQTSFFDSTNRTFFLTGLQIEVGSQATNFEHQSVGETLALCQRYLYNIPPSNFQYVLHGWSHSATLMISITEFPSTMRAAPSLIVEDAGQFTVYTSGAGTASRAASSMGLNGIGPEGGGVNITTASNQTAGFSGGVYNSNSNPSYIRFDAEL